MDKYKDPRPIGNKTHSFNPVTGKTARGRIPPAELVARYAAQIGADTPEPKEEYESISMSPDGEPAYATDSPVGSMQVSVSALKRAMMGDLSALDAESGGLSAAILDEIENSAFDYGYESEPKSMTPGQARTASEVSMNDAGIRQSLGGDSHARPVPTNDELMRAFTSLGLGKGRR